MFEPLKMAATGGLFGKPVDAKEESSSLFGKPAETKVGEGLFGKPLDLKQDKVQTSLFAATGTQGSLFDTKTQKTETKGSLFDAKPKEDPQVKPLEKQVSLFEKPKDSTGSLFDKPATQA